MECFLSHCEFVYHYLIDIPYEYLNMLFFLKDLATSANSGYHSLNNNKQLEWDRDYLLWRGHGVPSPQRHPTWYCLAYIVQQPFLIYMVPRGPWITGSVSPELESTTITPSSIVTISFSLLPLLPPPLPLSFHFYPSPCPPSGAPCLATEPYTEAGISCSGHRPST